MVGSLLRQIGCQDQGSLFRLTPLDPGTTVLDLGGHTIYGQTSASNDPMGVLGDGVKNVEVTNGTILGFGSGIPIYRVSQLTSQVKE